MTVHFIFLRNLILFLDDFKLYLYYTHCTHKKQLDLDFPKGREDQRTGGGVVETYCRTGRSGLQTKRSGVLPTITPLAALQTACLSPRREVFHLNRVSLPGWVLLRVR